MSRRWLQFSLRGFLLATTAFAVWLGLVAEKAMRQKEAVALLEEWGAKIEYGYNWQGPSKPLNLKVSPHGWSWLRKLLGRHFFDRVVNVELVSGHRFLTAAETVAAKQGVALELTDADFSAIGYLPDIRRLMIVGDLNVTEAGLKRLGRLKRLEWLILDNTSGRSKGGVTDEAVAFIERMPHLRTLHLEGNPISDVGLASVRWPANLLNLDLSGTRITDAGLESLQKISSLQRLVIMDCRVSDSAVARFQKAAPKCEMITGRW